MADNGNQNKIRSAWYEQLYHNPFIGFLVVDKDRNVIDANPTFARILGYDSLSEIIGRSARQNHPSEKSYQEFGKRYSEDVMNQKPQSLRYQFKKKDGSLIWVNLTGQPNQTEEGALWTVVDINDQVLAEEAVKQNENKFRLLADNTFDWEYWIDQNDEYVFVSPACESITGYPAEEFINNPRLIVELAREGFKDAVNEHFFSGRDCSAPACSLEFPILTKDGAEKWIEHNCKPLFDKDGNPLGRYGNNRDITERHIDKIVKERLFQQISEAKRAWEATMDCVDDLVIVIDEQGRIKRCNKSVISLTQSRYTDILDTDWKKSLEAVGVDFAPKNAQPYECHYTNKDRWFHIVKNYFEQEDGRTRTVITLHDFTEVRRVSQELEQTLKDLKQSQSKLLQSEKMASIGQLAAGVAHEINNPMGFISQNLRTLGKYVQRLADFIEAQKKTLKDPNEKNLESLAALEKKLKLAFLLEDTKDLITESLDGSERIQTIVRDLKTFSRVDQEGKQLVDLNACMDTTINIIWNEIKYNVEVEKDYGDLPLVTCFPQQISQIFMNLLINASHAIESQGIVELHSWTDQDHVFFDISDNGCGIEEKVLKRIFEPFFTTKDPGKGTGLGLSMVYDIIKSHKGEITAESEVGKGTTFHLSLPIEGPEEGS